MMEYVKLAVTTQPPVLQRLRWNWCSLCVRLEAIGVTTPGGALATVSPRGDGAGRDLGAGPIWPESFPYLVETRLNRVVPPLCGVPQNLEVSYVALA